MTNIYFLWVAIKICGSRNRLSELTGIDVDRISEWLSGTRAITLKNAIKIEKATNWSVTRDQLVSDRDKAFIASLKAEVEILKRSQPPLTFKQQVELGLAHEAALGCRKGARTDLQLSKNFNEVNVKNKKIVTEKASLRGRTEKEAAKLAGFGNFVTYHQAKKVMKNGVSELVAAVPQKVSIHRAFQISKHPPEKQLYFLGLDSSLISKALCEAESEKSADKWKQINSSSVHVTKSTEDKICPRCESLAILALLNMRAGLFQERKRKKIVDEENQDTETQIVSQNMI